MTRVTFGIASPAFLATNSILCLAKESDLELLFAEKAMKESFYVDDGLSSLHHQLQDLVNRGFKLYKWDVNSPKVFNSISPETMQNRNS